MDGFIMSQIDFRTNDNTRYWFYIVNKPMWKELKENIEECKLTTYEHVEVQNGDIIIVYSGKTVKTNGIVGLAVSNGKVEYKSFPLYKEDSCNWLSLDLKLFSELHDFIRIKDLPSKSITSSGYKNSQSFCMHFLQGLGTFKELSRESGKLILNHLLDIAPEVEVNITKPRGKHSKKQKKSIAKSPKKKVTKAAKKKNLEDIFMKYAPKEKKLVRKTRVEDSSDSEDDIDREIKKMYNGKLIDDDGEDEEEEIEPEQADDEDDKIPTDKRNDSDDDTEIDPAICNSSEDEGIIPVMLIPRDGTEVKLTKGVARHKLITYLQKDRMEVNNNNYGMNLIKHLEEEDTVKVLDDSSDEFENVFSHYSTGSYYHTKKAMVFHIRNSSIYEDCYLIALSTI